MTDILKQIDSFKEDAEKLQPVKPELEKIFWDKFRLEFNYNSNHIEGNTLTYGHTQLLLLFDKIGGDYSLRELEEMKAHDVALKLVKEAALDKEQGLTEKFIKEINELILVRPFYNEAITPDGRPAKRLIQPGKYKQYPNSVRLQNGEMFNYASPEETPAYMGDLIEWYRKEEDSKELHPVQLAALFHYRFVRIHPFDDSNGRTARLMMNYILVRNGFVPLVIESEYKKYYLIALNEADTGNIKAFAEYISKLSLRWQELYLKALKGEKIEEARDIEKEIELFKKDLKAKLDSDISLIKKIHQFSFLPLVEKLKDMLSKLDQFYDSTHISTAATDEFGKQVDIYNILDDISSAKAKAYRFVFSYHHIGYKASKKNINYSSECTLTIFQYNYQIEIDPAKKAITIKNNEYLTHDQIEELCSLAARKEFEFIKEIPL